MDAGQQADTWNARPPTKSEDLGGPVHSLWHPGKRGPTEAVNCLGAPSGTFAQERPLAVVQQAGRQQCVVGHCIGLHGTES